MLEGGDPAVMRDLTAAMRRAWIGFVRDGNPAHDGLPAWPEYMRPQRWTMGFDTMTGAIGDPAGLGLS